MDRILIDRVIDTVIKEQNSKKDHYTDWSLSEEYIDKMKLLGDKYRPIRWLPLDIPKIEFEDIDEFKSIWVEESIDVLRVRPDAAEPWLKDQHPLRKSSSYHVPSFRGLHLYENKQLSPISQDSFIGKLYTGNNKQLKRILEQVREFFPIHTMLSTFIWQSTREIKPHRDRGMYFNCPTEFRVMLHDENPGPTLYVVDTEHRDVNYIDCPDDTNSFCWSNGSQIHGSDFNGCKKWILCITGIPHTKKADELFSRSINKYKNVLNYKLDL